MNRRLISGVLIALALMFTLGLVTITTASKASAHTLPPTASAQTPGTFNIVLKKVNLVAEGKTIGYLEALTDGHGNKEIHGHLSALPDGSTGPFTLLLGVQNDEWTVSQSFRTAPQDLYLSETPSYSIAMYTGFLLTDYQTHVVYNTDFLRSK